MKIRRKSLLFLSLCLLGLFALTANRALADDEPDPPSRVARLSYINGQVSFDPAGTDDWVDAVLNRPITTGDKIWTDQNSRAELHIGSAVARLGEMTGFSFLNLSDNVIQIQLTEGTINLHVIRLGDDENIEVDTPNLAFSVLRPGHYRINVNEAGDTSIISVRDGEGEVTGGGSAFTLHPGDSGSFSGTDSLSSDVEELPDEDNFDNWCDERDLREEHAVARQYVADDVIGYEDLDDYGGWRPVAEYGTIWFPHVAVVGWAPYRYGHWAWVSPWGWTWVDDAPWGFAPFHYGRWVFVGGAWGWVPAPRPVVGVVYVRPVYAPALVAWVGGPHFAAGIGFAAGGFAAGVNVAWFPLGPREVFVPSYPVSRTYVTNINISNTVVERTVVNNYYNTTIVNKTVVVNNVTYVNQRVAGAVTVTSPHAFTSAQPVARNIVAVDQREVVSASVAVRAPQTVPPKEAVLGSGRPVNVHPPAQVMNRQVVAKTAPPPPPPSFAAHQAAIEKNQGQPISVAQTRQLQTTQARAAAAPPVKMAPPSRPATPQINHGNNNPGPLNNNANRPNNQPANNANRPNNPPANNANNRPPVNNNPNSRPPNTSRPAVITNEELEQKHQQETKQLQTQHDQEYQQLQQKQAEERQNLQQQEANQQKQKELQEQHQQQLEQLQQKQQQQQQQLKQKQETEHNQAKQAQKPAQSKPKDDKPPHK
jgi:hypothetical protein